MILTPKNWKSFQHYKDRSPAWIKLHKGLLDDFAYSRLPLASRALAPMLWLLASEYEEGGITASLEEIAYRLHITEADLSEALTPLIDGGFFVASETLARSEPEASLERENIEKRREEEDSAASAARGRSVEKSPKKAAKPLPSEFPISDRINAYSVSLGFTRTELEREHAKFCNHAKQNDRRCVEWEPAEENWLMAAAERLGKSPAGQPGGLDWNVVLELYKRTGHWSKWAGSDPSSPACAAPPELLAKYGIEIGCLQ